MTELRTERTTLRRRGARGSHDRAVIDPILDEGLLCHVGWTDVHGPAVIPTTYARMGDDVLMHGAIAARWLQPGLPLCLVVTLLDGLVLARSAMHHSANYRAVVLFGVGELVVERAAKLRALEAIVEHLVPGRTGGTRGPSSKEIAATAVLRLPLTEASAKGADGGAARRRGGSRAATLGRRAADLAARGDTDRRVRRGDRDAGSCAHVETRNAAQVTLDGVAFRRSRRRVELSPSG
jgi:hypothetical protein